MSVAIGEAVSFGDLGVPADLVAALAKGGITQPFEIQAATIPDALAGRDVCGRAPTGSGKTVAFGVPLIARIDKARRRQPSALILAPTRELTAQICQELEPLAATRGLRVCSVYGGVGYETQRRHLNRGVDILVVCPGRLADLLRQDALDLEQIQVVVVDEADRMADMGFLPEVRRLLDQTPSSRQTMLFSATLDGAIKVLTRDYQRDPVRHDAGAPEPDGRGADHVFWRVDGPQRAGVTAELVPAAGPTIVFCRTRRGADRLAAQLEKAGVRAAAIHGGRSQNQRDRALVNFKGGRVEALVATDVAARGIHVDGVACVVHYDTPEDGKAYLHRSGRTARAGAAGLVVSLVGHGDTRTVSRMQRDLEIPAPMTPPDVSAIAKSHGQPKIRVAPNKPLAVVPSEDAPWAGSARRDPNVATGTGTMGRGHRPQCGAVVARTGAGPRAAAPASDRRAKPKGALEFSLGSTKEFVLAKSRSTFGKRDREMAKTAKANAKRARRDARADAEPAEPTVNPDGVSADELVERLKELHESYEDNRISLEDFDAARTDLVDRIALIMASE